MWWRWRRAPRRIIGGESADRTPGAKVSIAAARGMSKPYVRRNKNDAPVRRGGDLPRRWVGRASGSCRCVRSITQADLMRHRTRELLAGQRTALLKRFARPSGRGNRPRRTAGRVSHAYGLKRMVADGFNARMARSWSPIACAAHFVRLSAKSTRFDEANRSDRQGACGVRSKWTRPPSG